MASMLSPGDRHDIQTMRDTTLPGIPTLLNFADDVHYRFYLKQLELAGVTRADYPEQFNVLDRSRDQHQLNGPPLISPEEGYDYEPIQAIIALGSGDGLHYNCESFSSVPYRPFFSQMTLGLFDPDNNPIGVSTFVQQFNAGTDLTLLANGTSEPEEQVVVAISTYAWQDQNGRTYHGSVQAATSIPPTHIGNTAPMPKPGQTETKLCLGRSEPDCTYKPVGGDDKNVLMPISGSITFPKNINPAPPTPNTCLITMARPEIGQGGGCTVKSTTDFFNDPNTHITGGTITWDLAQARFEPIGGCLTPNAEAIYTFFISLTVAGLPSYVTITSGTVCPDDPYYLQIPKLVVYYSCLAEGTEITMSNGTAKRIEHCRAGERVLADTSGAVLEIDSVVKGTELPPMLRIMTDLGHNVLVTDGHPMVTPDGVTLARLLAVGDHLVSIQGPAQIISITSEIFTGHIWNLNVGPRVEDFNAIPDGRTFFAGGLLVGDNQMQFKYNRLHRYVAESVRQALPPQWLADFESHLAHRKLSTPI